MKLKLFSIALHAFFSGLNASLIIINLSIGTPLLLSVLATVFCGFLAYDSARRIYNEVKNNGY